MMKVRKSSGQFAALVPWVSLAVVVVLAQALPNHAQADGAAAARKMEVAACMSNVPYFIDRWVGADEEVPQVAVELLKPNAIFSRTYRAPARPRMHVLLVHCGDARDMIGHYPPVCYPSNGWVRVESAGEPMDQTLMVSGTSIPVHLYKFRRLRGGGAEDVIRIFNAFVLPDGTVTPNIDDINKQSERLQVSAQGVAQLQLITAASVDPADARLAAGELLSGMPELMRALQVQKGTDSDS